MKKCKQCKITKPQQDFPKLRRSKSGYNLRCKACCNTNNKAYRDGNKSKVKEARKRYYHKNKDKHLTLSKKYYQKNKEKKAEYDKIYREKNKFKIASYKKEWENKNKNNPVYKIKRNLRRRVNHALNGNRKADKTFNLIGCTPEYFKNYISNLFKPGMTWENYGEWHIDHINPCYTFNLADKQQQKECFHYTNQRPLWKHENLTRPRNDLKPKTCY